MIAHLAFAGVKVPIVTTSSWEANPLSALPALTSGDLVDVHFVWAHGGAREEPVDRRQSDSFASPRHGSRVKPLSVTRVERRAVPAPDRHFPLPLYVAASARLQGWNALMAVRLRAGPSRSPRRTLQLARLQRPGH